MSAIASHSASSPLRRVLDSLDNRSTFASASTLAILANAPGMSDIFTLNSTSFASGSANGMTSISLRSGSASSMTYIPSLTPTASLMGMGTVTLPFASIRITSLIRMFLASFWVYAQKV